MTANENVPINFGAFRKKMYCMLENCAYREKRLKSVVAHPTHPQKNPTACVVEVLNVITVLNVIKS